MQGHSSRRVHLDLGPLFAVCIMATLPASVRVSVRVVGSDFIPGPKARLRKDLSKGQGWRMAGTSVAVTATACCSVGLRARKPTAEMLKNKVAKGMQRREMQMDAPDAIEEFQGLKDDPLASWSLLGDQEFLARILTVLFLAFLPCAYLTSKVYPVSNEIGELLPQNILADVSLWFQCGSFVPHCSPFADWLSPIGSESAASSAQHFLGDWWWRILCSKEECCQPTWADFA